MVELSVEGNNLNVEVLGWSRWLGFKKSIEVPLESIKSVTAGAGLPQIRWTDVRVLGTGIPGKMAVGTYWLGLPHRWAFLDVRSESKEVVTLELEGQRYATVIVEVKDAQAAIRQIRRLN